MNDLGSDREAAAWTNQFFNNSALPGGIIELDHDLDDSEFDDLVRRWRQAHQGVQNSHRVAIIERGHWKDRAFSVRDLQVTELRQGLRDAIIGALGIPKSLIGAVDDVNRANAEASEMIFARWTVVPMLEIIKAGLNKGLAQEFGDNLTFDYADPTPAARDIDLQEAIGGFGGNILTLNEARRRLLEAPDPDGDVYQRDLTGSTSPIPEEEEPEAEEPEEEEPEEEDTDQDDFEESLGSSMIKANFSPLHPDEVNDIGQRIENNWFERFKRELSDIQAHLANLEAFRIPVEQRNASPEGNSTPGIANAVTKLDPTEVRSYDWDWFEKYGKEVIDELAQSYSFAMSNAASSVPLPQVQQIARLWAMKEASALLTDVNGISLTSTTRKRVELLVSDAIANGESLTTLTTKLNEDPAFNRKRAQTIARTETARALGQGQLGAAVSQQRNQKKWVVDFSGEPDTCNSNAAQGWIPIDRPFQSEDMTIPQHPNCRCNVIYRTVIEETYCPNCKKRLQVKNLIPDESTIVYCRSCNKEWSGPDFMITEAP